ncbi:MAG: GTPase [Acidilobus sp.]
MVTNLPAEAAAKLNKYSEARTTEEKIRALEEFLSSVPKHKGTEKLRLWATRRLAELREELERERARRLGGSRPSMFVEKEGAGQIVLVGPPNSGKSSIVARLTNAKVIVSPIPYSTQTPVPGMATYLGVRLQLVDTPPLINPNGSVNSRVVALARNADVVSVVVGLDSQDPDNDLAMTLRALEERGIAYSLEKGFARVERRREGGVTLVAHGQPRFTGQELRELLAGYRIHHALIEVYGPATLDDVEAALLSARTYKPTLVVLNKADIPNADSIARGVALKVPKDVPRVMASTVTGVGLESVLAVAYRLLNVKRVFTKKPNAPASPEPLVIRADATVRDIAGKISPELARNMKYARVWGKGVRYGGQRVGPDYVPQDGDIVEIR